jgi:hypothetical protein
MKTQTRRLTQLSVIIGLLCKKKEKIFMQFFCVLAVMFSITGAVQAVSTDYSGWFFEDKNLPGIPSKNSLEYEQELINWGQIYKLPITPAIAKEIINKPANADHKIWQVMRDVVFIETLINSIKDLESSYINKIPNSTDYAEKTYERLNKIVKIWQEYDSDSFWEKPHSAMTNLALIRDNQKFYENAKSKLGYVSSIAKGNLLSVPTDFAQDKAIEFLCGEENSKLCSYAYNVASIRNAAGLYSLGASLITDSIIAFGTAQLESRPLGKFFALYYYTLKYYPELVSSNSACPVFKEDSTIDALNFSCSVNNSMINSLLSPQAMTHTIDVGLIKGENAQTMRAIATSFAMLSQLNLSDIKKEITAYAYLSYLSNTMTYQQYIDVNDCEK